MADNTFILLDQEVLGLQTAITQEMRKIAPVDTGRLKRSIKPQPIVDTPQGIKAPITYVNYGIFPDFGTKYQAAQRFTEKSQEKVVDAQMAAVAEAAGLDVLNALDLPKEIDITLQV
jgi:hypothetical protein